MVPAPLTGAFFPLRLPPALAPCPVIDIDRCATDNANLHANGI